MSDREPGSDTTLVDHIRGLPPERRAETFDTLRSTLGPEAASAVWFRAFAALDAAQT